MASSFNKRIYSPSTFRAAVAEVLDHLGDLRAAARGGRVSKAFAERIMLAVTQVNGCRYCHYGHTRAALRAGVSEAEIRSITLGALDQLPAEELVALVYAQHFAESGGRPDPASWQRLQETYGPETARDIMAYIRMIMMGNLLGNTFDALLSRLSRRPAAGSSLGQEFGVLLGAFVFIPAGLLRRALSPA